MDEHTQASLKQMANMSLLLEHLALMIASMTSLISKYEMVIENHRSVLCTMDRIERKLDSMNKQEEITIPD